MCQDTFCWGGGGNHLMKKKVTENTVASSLAAWLTFDQLSCKFENIGGCDTPTPPHWHIPGIGPLCCLFSFGRVTLVALHNVESTAVKL